MCYDLSLMSLVTHKLSYDLCLKDEKYEVPLKHKS